MAAHNRTTNYPWLVIAALVLALGILLAGGVRAALAAYPLTDFRGSALSREAIHPAEVARPDGCTLGWNVVSSPNVGSHGSFIKGVAAVSASDAWAVGYYNSDTGPQRLLIEHWNGTAWSVATGPNVGSGSSSLQAITALSATDVWAVGYSVGDSFSQTLILHWDGTAWSVVTSPNASPYENMLHSVAAISANDIWAVGEFQDVDGNHTLTVHWNGTSWNTVTSPSSGSNGDELFSVAAAASNDVWAVGCTQNCYNLGAQTLIIHWDGTQWTLISSPNTGFAGNVLYGVVAISTNNAWAVGEYYTGVNTVYHTLIQHWDGTHWSIVSSPNIGSDENHLYAISATAANDMWAVGAFGFPTQQTLILHWDGTAWTRVSSPSPAPQVNRLNAVAALAPNDVWAAGYYGADQTLIEHYTGPCVSPTPTPSTCQLSWSVVSSPYADSGSSIYGVAALAANDIWAVGYTPGQSFGQDSTYTMHWDGTHWSTINSPTTFNTILTAVAGTSPNDVWAVGYSGDPGISTRTFVIHWDGTAWSVVTAPNPGSATNTLQGVLALSPGNAWAVGSEEGHILLLHWDGSAWSAVTSTISGYLNGISAVSANDIWAVGYGNNYTPLVVHWNGTQWSLSPNSLSGRILQAVAALANDNVWAIGYSFNGTTETSRTFTMHWDGSSWQTVSSPNLGSSNNYLYGISALSPENIWAVGYYDSGGNEDRTIALNWNGTAWTTADALNPGSRSDHFRAVAALAPNDIWALGNYSNYGEKTSPTLAEHLSGSCSTQTATASPSATGTNTPIPANTATSTATSQPQATGTTTRTATAIATRTTVAATATPTACAITFTDVQPTDYFYTPVRYLYCRGAISGYSDNTFRPYANTTRGQLSKIVMLAEGWTIVTPTGSPTFRDVPASNPFYVYIETAYAHRIISGYSCGTDCLEFRPNNNVTRAQLTKIVVLAQNWEVIPRSTPDFRDVPLGDPFFGYIETAYAHTIISGYSCGTGCLEFRPGAYATRGQIAKIVYSAVAQP